MWVDLREFVYKNKKKLIIVGLLILLTIIGISVYFIIMNRLYSVTLNTVISPSIAKVMVGDNEYGALGTYKIRPGEYDVEVYADGFITKTGKLVAVEYETVEISLALEPTAENSNWYDKHPWDATAAGDIRSDTNMQEYYDLQKKNEILNYVPYYNFNYTIGYEDGCNENGGGICLTVDADFGFRRYATEYLQLTGQDLSWYYVKGYESPFRRLELSVPDGLEFNGSASGLVVSSDELSAVNTAANRYIDSAFDTDGYTARILQTKKYGDQYFGVTIAVYEGDGSLVYDIYRMIVGLVDGEYVALTNADVILSRYQNPQLPGELLRVFNSF